MFPGLDLYGTDPSQPLTTAREELDFLDRDISDLSDLDRGLSVRDKQHSLSHNVQHELGRRSPINTPRKKTTEGN